MHSVLAVGGVMHSVLAVGGVIHSVLAVAPCPGDCAGRHHTGWPTFIQ
jgi:hypothetical protein